MRPLPALLAILAFAGCSSSTEQATTGNVTNQPPVIVRSQNDILVDVDGATLTRAMAEAEVQRYINKSSSPGASRQEPRDELTLMNSVIESFVRQTVLIKEAARRRVLVTADDEQVELDKLKKSLPAGTTLKQAMVTTGINPQQVRAMVRTRLLIDRLLVQTVMDKAIITDTELDKYCEENKDKLAIPETVHAAHILVMTSPKDDPEETRRKRELIDNLREQLLNGADFAELARNHSDCPSSQNGGDLGVFGRGQMVPPFENAAFSQKVNEIGPVVGTKFGYHVVKVLERRHARVVPRERVAEELIKQKTQDAILVYVNELKSKAKITYGAI